MDEITSEYTHWARIHLSPSHLFSAAHFARMSACLENEADVTQELIKERHRSCVIGSIFASVAFLEAAINELYVAASDKMIDHPGLADEFRTRLATIWSIEHFRRGARVLEKYQCALGLAGAKQFDKGARPYQDAKLLVDLRNALVHFVPETVPIKAESGVEIPVHKFGKQFRGKFKTNPFAAKYAVISSSSSPETATYPFFPEHCLSHGCAQWAVNTSLTFADHFFKALNLEWYYEYLRPVVATDCKPSEAG